VTSTLAIAHWQSVAASAVGWARLGLLIVVFPCRQGGNILGGTSTVSRGAPAFVGLADTAARVYQKRTRQSRFDWRAVFFHQYAGQACYLRARVAYEQRTGDWNISFDRELAWMVSVLSASGRSVACIF
jgi:hypothetical protein